METPFWIMAGCVLVLTILGARLIASFLEDIDRLKGAIRKHRDMAWDDRCLEDDRELYAVLGEPIPDVSLPPKGDMLESCRRYIEQRGCPLADLPPDKMTIRQLEDRTKELERENRKFVEVLQSIASWDAPARRIAVGGHSLACDLTGTAVAALKAESPKFLRAEKL